MRNISILLFALGCSSTPVKSSPPAAVSPLQQALLDVSAGADGTVAVTVLNFATGERASVHGDRRMPMMSVFKVPLVVVALARVDEGAWKLDQTIEISESELRPGVSPIADAWVKGEHTVTLETMLRKTIQNSDNTGGDKLVAMMPDAQARLRAFGIDGVDIAEQEINMEKRLHGASPELAARHEIEAPPNGATTDALVAMLAKLEHGVLKDPTRAWLHETMAGTKTGPKRLTAGLPEGTPLEHKTGTGETIGELNLATNDIGVITLPNGQRVAIAVLTAGSRREQAKREAVIASMACATWKYFTASAGCRSTP
jgi:beta-lactamase class A